MIQQVRGLMLSRMGDPAGAEGACRQWIDSACRSGNREQLMIALQSLGALLSSQGRLEEARTLVTPRGSTVSPALYGKRPR